MGFQKGNKINLGKECKPETRLKIGLANKGRKPSLLAIINSVKARKGKKLSLEHRKKLTGYTEENSHAWKGKKASYTAKHAWIYKKFGKPKKCVLCDKDGLVGKYINWANISGEYKRKRNDWLRLCKPCHVKFDDSINKGWKTRRRKLQF